MIIHRGTLTIEKLRELAAKHLGKTDTSYDPHTNPNAISIIKQPDGNYIGEMAKFGRVIGAREVGPETVLQKLLTHDGN